MTIYSVLLTIDTDDESVAEGWREEIAGTMEDMRDSSAFPDADVTVGELTQASVDSGEHAELVQEARDRYAGSSNGDIEVDDDAMLSFADNEVWVSAWLRISLLPEEEDEQ